VTVIQTWKDLEVRNFWIQTEDIKAGNIVTS
jgi:hypothetical protein